MQGERSAAERGRSLQGPLRVCDVHVLLFNLQVTSAKHLQRLLLTGLYYISKEGEIKQRAGPVIKYSQTCKEVVSHCRASAAQRSEAVLCKAPFVYDMHVLLFNL